MLQECIATRKLKARVDGKPIDIDISIFKPSPHPSGVDWQCRYSIEWPTVRRENNVGGVDAIQALFLALQFIGAELYAGRPSKLQNLTWLKADEGYGFPLPSNLRDLAIGGDRQL